MSSPPSSSSADNGVSQIKNHAQYFIPTGDTEFLAQSVLFKVHRHFFERESNSFREILSSEGGGDTKPYTLDVKADDFAHFLWVIYDEDYDYDNQPLERWLIILRLATRWGFHKMRKLVVRQLEKIELNPIDKIKIYSDFKIDAQLLLPSYTTLAMSPTLPSLSEAQKLSLETILKLTMAREKAVQKAAEDGCRSPTTADAGDGEVNRIICEIFELANVNSASINDTAANPVPTLQKPDPEKKKKNANTNGTSNTTPNGKHANGSR
ncbi:hypothetical protein DFH29DRAFT_426171 [Suillus ampliporus]|nr:hypothetical protein DFH29DRAFT_426171 [Suillus ampliporus]